MPRNRRKAVPEDNGPVPHHDELVPDQATIVADIYRLFEQRFDRKLNRLEIHFDQREKTLDELMEKTRETNQRLVGLEHEARQPRLAMEADATQDTKIERSMGIVLQRFVL